jgi:hypothetical protein
MHVDLDRVITQAVARRILQLQPEFKPILANVEFLLEQKSTEEYF